MKTVSCYAIIPAAGVGQRAGEGDPKQYRLIKDKTVLECAIAPFIAAPWISKVIIVLHPEDTLFKTLKVAHHPKIMTTVGGQTRADSVYQGLRAVEHLSASPHDFVLVHDAARPCLHPDDLTALYQHCQEDPVGGILATPVTHTLKQVDHHTIESTVSRENLWEAQTPQMFKVPVLKTALDFCIHNKIDITDESSAVEKMGKKPKIITALHPNPKLTFAHDIRGIQALMTQSDAHSQNSIRIGQGFDIHRFKPGGDSIVLAGCTIPHTQGIEAHSDGDVVLHALCDALLGALALGDIGAHFPDTDPEYRGKESRYFVEKVLEKMRERRYTIGNIDMTITTEKPKLRPYIDTLRQSLAILCDMAIEDISIKAKTMEKLDAIGAELALSAQVIVLLRKVS